jgi:hypothetical protein
MIGNESIHGFNQNKRRTFNEENNIFHIFDYAARPGGMPACANTRTDGNG